MKHEPKRKMVKSSMASLILKIFGRGIKGAYKIDSNVKGLLNLLPTNTTIRMRALSFGPYLTMTKLENSIKIHKSKEEFNNIDLDICFKSLDEMADILFGVKGVAQAYADSGIVIHGDITDGMVFVEVADIITAYLFPGFITKRFLKAKPKKQSNMLRMYMFVLFNI